MKGATMSMKKSYRSAFKAQVVLEILKEEKTLTQIASAYGIHPSLLRDWKALALTALPTTFEKRDTRAATDAAHAQEVQDLYAEIGRLTTQVNWLKKKLGH
jgi:putative transposase